MQANIENKFKFFSFDVGEHSQTFLIFAQVGKICAV
jgi:hypothetical protein